MLKGFFPENETVREIPVRDRKGNPLRLKTVGSIIPKGGSEKNRTHFRIGRVVWGQQSNHPDKIILIEELHWKGRRYLRFGYRTTTYKKGVWWWGESALMAPTEDVGELLRFAEEKGLLLA